MRNRNPRSAVPIGGAPSKSPLKHTPFPGLIDEHKWTVLEGRWPSFIDRKDMEGVGGIMQVPLDNTPEGRKLRLHEQAHVAFTPNIGAGEIAQLGVEERTINACEDARIIQMMNDRNEDWAQVNVTTNILPPALRTKHERDFKALATRLATNAEANTASPVPASAGSDITLLDAARLIAGSRGYAEGHHFNTIAAAANLGWMVPEVENLHRKHLEKRKGEPSFEDTIAYARDLERLFEDLEEQIREQAEAIADADLDDQMPAPVHPIPEEIDSRWGEMLKETAPLTEKLRGDPSRRTRSSDTGSIPRYMHRLPTDQRIFGRRRKHRVFQGTVLIDLSGSMSLAPGEVDEILSRWPAVTIATYSGGMPNARHQGMLRIVAKDGRRASIDWLAPPAPGGDNLIDGPALDWLTKQKGPRVWISDGGVTGVGGQTEELLMDAARKVSRGKIKRIPNVQQLIRG